MATRAHTITARKPFRCDDYLCKHQVQPGEDYARHVAFPNDNDLGNTGFWVMRICATCHTRYGREMPPRKHAKARAPRRSAVVTLEPVGGVL